MKKYLAVAFVALITVVACKKPKNDDPSNPGSSKTLKRIVETTAGQTTTYNFSYNAAKQLTSVANTDNSEVMSFSYANDGNVTKIESKEGDAREVLQITYNNGVPVSGSYKTYEKDDSQTETVTEQYTLNYTVANGLVTKIKIIVPADPANDIDGYEQDYDLSYNNGNLSMVQTTGVYNYKAIFTYGNKKPVFPAILKYVVDPAGFSLQFFSKNDLLTMTYDYPGTELDHSINTVYTYDAQGYVLTSDDGETKTTFHYE